MTSNPNRPTQQPNPIEAAVLRDRLQNQFGLLGLRSQVQVGRCGPHVTLAFSSLWDVDALKLAEALDGLPELKPYVAHQTSAAHKGGGEYAVSNCIHLGVRAGDTCPNCNETVGTPLTPQPAPQPK